MESTETVRVPVKYPTRDRIRRRKVGGDSFDDVINRLLDETEPPTTAAVGEESA